MSEPQPIMTPRLTLVPTTPDLLRADATDREQLARLLSCAIPADWPEPLWGGAIEVLDKWLNPANTAAGWGPWYVLLTSPRTLIGTLGFKGAPDASGTVEIGYGAVPSQQARGYTSEAVAGLIGWAFENGARTILVHTFERNTASLRLLQKCGFSYVGPGTEEVDEAERQGMGELMLFRRERA